MTSLSSKHVELEMDSQDEAQTLINTESTSHHKHITPLSPTPKHSPIDEPLKAPAISLSNPILTSNLSSKQFYKHIENLVINYVNQSNQIINHDSFIPLHSITNTLHQLKNLLIPHEDALLHSFDETHSMEVINEKEKYNHSNSSNATPLKYCTHSTRELWKQKGKFIPSSALLHHHLYSINVDKYCGLFRGSVRQDWNTIESDDDEERNWEELKPHWFELFFDLMFVAAIVHISTEVADAYKHAQYIFITTVFPQFGLLVLCWLEQALYHSRFRMTQTVDGLFRFLYMSVVLLMGLSIGHTTNQTPQKIFLITYMFTKLIMCIQFIKSSLIIRAFNHSIYMIIENIISIVTVICIEIFIDIEQNEYSERQWIWTVIYCILFVYSWFHMAVLIYLQCIRDLGVNIPINVPHIAERMGAFVLIILGETVISIMVQHVESTKDGIITAYTTTMAFFVIVYCIGKLYFESQPSEHELHHHTKSHAMSTSVWRARIYKWFHILLFFGLLGLGLGSKITIHELPHYGGEKPVYVFLPGFSCIIVCICINIIRLTHPFDYSDRHPHCVIGVWITRVICIIVMLGILFTWQFINHFVILGVYVIGMIIQIFVDFEAKTRLIITKEVHKNKSLHYHKSKPINDQDDNSHLTTTNECSFVGAF